MLITTALNRNAKIAPPALAFQIHQDVPRLKIKKQIKLWLKIFREERPWLKMSASTTRSGIKLKNIRGVIVPEKGKAKNMIKPPIKDAIQRFFRFNVIGKYNG